MINKAPKQSTRLPMLAGLPNRADIANLLAQARKQPRIIQLPWVVEAKGILYILACNVDPDMIDPQWTLSAGGVVGGLSPTIVWTHSTIDLDLILNLTLMESEVPTETKDAAQSLSELKEIIAADKGKGSPKDSYGARDPYARGASAAPGANHSSTAATQNPVVPAQEPARAANPLPVLPESTPAPTSWSQIPLPAGPGQSAGAQAAGAVAPLPAAPGLAAPGLAAPNLPPPPTLPGALPGLPGGLNGGLPGGLPGGLSGGLPGGLPGALPGGLPGTLPGGLPGALPGGLAPGMPGALPGGLPGGATSSLTGGLNGSLPAPPTLSPPPGAMPQPVGIVPAAHVAPPQPVAAAQPVMQGSLSEMQPLGLLQTLAMGKKTGKLIVEQASEHIDVFFTDGAVIHALSREGEGEVAILDLLILTDGSFIFIPEDRTTERTVNRPINTIISESMALVDKQQFLTKAGLKMSSYLTRTNLSLTESDFDSLTKNAPVPNRELLKAFFQQIDQHSRFFELLRKFPLTKLDWVPILYALVTTNLVEISEKPSQTARLADLASVGLDTSVIQEAYFGILRPDTGILSFPLFLHFLEQEFYRSDTTRLPFSLLVFDVSLKDNDLHPLSAEVVCSLNEVVEQMKRTIDILGHFQEDEFALILPATGAAGALLFANQLQERLAASTIFGADPEAAADCFCGIASWPDDTNKVELLLAAALEAKNYARETGKGTIAFKSLYHTA